MNTTVHMYDPRCSCGRCGVETERRIYQEALVLEEWKQQPPDTWPAHDMSSGSVSEEEHERQRSR